MRYGILGDIHSNIEALKAIFGKLSEYRCDRFIALGDIVGYGPSPAECIDFIKAHDIQCVKGNHDVCVTGECNDAAHWDLQDYAKQVIFWTRDVLDESYIEWLRRLPYIITGENEHFVHASMETIDGEYWPYVLDQKTAMFHFYLQEKRICFCGHAHIPLIFTCSSETGIKMELLQKFIIAPDSRCKYLFNAGSVGQPRDFDHRSAAVFYDSDCGLVELIRAEYDVALTQKKILQANLPSVLAARLSRGR